jgi:hypothetical protein
MDERLFWRTMTPARLHALYNEYFGMQAGPAHPEPAPQQRSLSQYLAGG